MNVIHPTGVPAHAPWSFRPGLVSVTFTGVDEATSEPQLARLSQTHGVIEWGVLYSHDRAGGGRYPSRAWIESIGNRWDPQWRRALHLCGQAAHDWIAGDSAMRALAKSFNRIQLNVVGRRTDVDALNAALHEGAHPAVITQQHEGNAPMTQALMDCINHAVLFDGSGGRGRLPEIWPAPLAGKAVGYGGGLGPTTIACQAHRISQQTQGCPHWLDMEQAVRDAKDCFSLDKVALVLDELSMP